MNLTNGGIDGSMATIEASIAAARAATTVADNRAKLKRAEPAMAMTIVGYAERARHRS